MIKEEIFDEEETSGALDGGGPFIQDIGNIMLPPLMTPLNKNRQKQTPKRSRGKSQHEGVVRTCTTQHINEPVSCEICDETFPNNVKFALHSINHNDGGQYSCQFCDYKNTSQYCIVMHVKTHEGTTKYKCEICNKSFTKSVHAVEHKNFHTGEKPFQCEICGKHFMFSSTLSQHKRKTHRELLNGIPAVKYECVACNKSYPSKPSWKKHNSRKHNKNGTANSYLCDICGKQFAYTETLKFHRRTHMGVKPFVCRFCSKSFIKKERLKEHERVHTGERPFLCKFCGKGFTQRTPLKLHERIHTGERPYFCKICSRGFISKAAMDTHIKCCTGPE